jgi:glycosyltransferase involved in cell wall biosynthesis
VYPTNDDLPEIIDVLDPDLVVADVVDDHRTFAAPGSARYAAFERNYREVLARSDVVLANCDPVAEAMRRFAPEVHVVPNGCELLDLTGGVPKPKELEGLAGPVIGYVGNLSQRLDIPLLEALATDHRDWQFVFVGSAHHDRTILALGALDNVHFLGVRPYEESLRFMRHFDVAIIPHLDDRMTRSMNPLKAFVYCSTGVPVVSTPVANLEVLYGLITIADGPTAFAEAIERALETGHRPPDRERLAPHSWPARVEQAIEAIDRAASPGPRVAP